MANGKARRSRAEKSSKGSSKSRSRTKTSSNASRGKSTQKKSKGGAEKASKASRKKSRPTPEPLPPAPKKNWSLILSVIAVVIAALALIITITTRKGKPEKVDPDIKKIYANNSGDNKNPKASKELEDKAKDSPRPQADNDPSNTSEPTKKAKDAPPPDDGALRMEPEGETRSVKVIGIIDGDTLRLFGGEKVRLIGINTPEKNEPLCAEATDLLKRLVEGQDVTLAFDKEKKDRYGRSLAFVYAGGVFVNGEIIRQGLAYFYEFKPNVRYSKLFLKLQREARAANRYIWTQKHEPASEYSASRRSARFHRPNCKRGPKKSKVTWSSRDEALDTGRSPCPDCKP